MARPVYLYASSSPDLILEREIVAQVTAELPLSIGWRIGHTPRGEMAGQSAVAVVADADFYVLILGQDFAAPMGAELRRARAAGLTVMAFRKQRSRSPSAQDALCRAELDWHDFRNPAQFRTLFARILLQEVLRRADRLGLQLDEVERLMAKVREEERAPDRVESDAGGAGASGVILGREVWDREPRDLQ